MSGDAIRQLPLNRERQSKPGELETIYSLFQPKSLNIIKQAVSPFKGAIVGALLFGLLSLPFVLKFSDVIFKNPIYGRLILMLAFLIIFFLVTKNWK